MKCKLYLPIVLPFLLLGQTTLAQAFADKALSNLNRTTAINTVLLPKANNTFSIGSNVLKWKNVYLYNLVFSNGSIQSTAFIPYTMGDGISISLNKITNTAPDKIVMLSAGNGIAVTGSYPRFTISNTTGLSPWISNNVSVFCNTSNIGIGTDSATAKLQVVGGDALINGLTVGVGSGALHSNIAVGLQALYNNVSGFSNTVFGSRALYTNSNGYDNSAIGENALYSNIDGIENTSIGNGTLYYNVSGYGNTAVGNGALLNNGKVPNLFKGPEGCYNVANGIFSLFNNTTGSHNAAFGTGTLNVNTKGSFNTCVGAYSNAASSALINATAIGANSIVNNDNKIRLGDVNVTVVESAAGSWTTSDGRFKNNIREDVVGLSFIKLLRPVLYNFDANKFDEFLSKGFPDSIKTKRKEALKKINSKAGKILQTGFIAQEVEAAAKKAGYNYNGVHVPENDADNYSLSYEKLVVPLVKAVQELSEQNEIMKKELQQLKVNIAAIEQKNNNQKVVVSSASLQQNVPNPFIQKTTIPYDLSSGAHFAEILITDKQGNNIKRISVNGTGKGTIDLNTVAMAAGVYQYSLFINGSVIETRQMTLIQ